MTDGAPFLYLLPDGIMSSFTIPTVYLIAGLLALALSTHGITWSVTRGVYRGNNTPHNETFNDFVDMHDRTATLHGLLVRGILYWGAPVLLVMLPLYIAGSNAYECGNYLVKTTSAYLADALVIEGVASVALVVIGTASVVFAAVFRTTFRGSRWGQSGRVSRTSTGGARVSAGKSSSAAAAAAVAAMVEAMAVEAAEKAIAERQQQQGEGVQEEEGDEVDGEEEGERRAAPPKRSQNIKHGTRPAGSRLRRDGDNDGRRRHPFLLFLLWVSSLILLSFPSIIYGLTTAVPTRDSILGEWLAPVAWLVHKTAPMIITFINSVILPVVVDYCCDRSGAATTGSNRVIVTRGASRGARLLLLVSRLLTTWVVPVIVVMVFSNLCGRQWLLLWHKCKNSTTMKELDVLGPSGLINLVPGSVCNIINGDDGEITNENGYIIGTVLVAGSDICTPERRDQYAHCGKAVVEAMAPLLIGKMAVAVLLLPAFTIFRWRLAPDGKRGCMKRVIFFNCCDKRTNEAPTKKKGTRLDSMVAQVKELLFIDCLKS